MDTFRQDTVAVHDKGCRLGSCSAVKNDYFAAAGMPTTAFGAWEGELDDFDWGLLGPGSLARTRRTRTFGVGSAVRRFNDLAVPGIGGAWFGMQLVLATLDVAVAEKARSQGLPAQNVETANAIEALGCLFAFESNGWKRDPRLRGVNKRQAHAQDLAYSRVAGAFFVTRTKENVVLQRRYSRAVDKTTDLRVDPTVFLSAN